VKARHHFWSSIGVGSALFWATGSGAALVGSMVGGFLIDGDHIIDQLWSIRHGAPFKKSRKPDAAGGRAASHQSLKSWVALLRPRKLVRLPLVFHSYELLAVITVLTFILRTPFMIGLVTGYALHISLDVMRHHREFRSPFFYLLSYRLAQRFRRDQLIKPEYL
jgi:hypothetical protein